MEIIVIYHRADFDGKFCCEIARRFFGTKAGYVGWDYGDPLPPIHETVKEIYMLDISIDGMMSDPRLVWIDHHKSAMEKYAQWIRGYRIDGVAACRLAWQYFFTGNCVRNPMMQPDWKLPGRAAFESRHVEEPYAVKLAGEYDIWDRRDPNAEIFQHALRSCDLAPHWNLLLTMNSTTAVDELMPFGRALHYAKNHENESIAKHLGFTVAFEGLTFLAINAARYNSHLFTAALKPEHDGCLGFNFDGKDWRVSLYGVPGKPDIDFSKIAVKYGGGGHKQACGFKTKTLPFLPAATPAAGA